VSALETRPRVFLVCSGLGHVRRGYEASIEQCFVALSHQADLELMLFKGGGADGPGQRALWNIPRGNRWSQKLLARIDGGAYTLEQWTFALGLLRHLWRETPHLVYFADVDTGLACSYFRRWTGLEFRLLFRNGAPHNPPPAVFDHTQQLTNVYVEHAKAAGVDPDKLTHLPPAFDLRRDHLPLSSDERSALRRRLNLPVDQPILLCVGAYGRSHKRIDYLLSEVGHMSGRRPFVLVIGEREAGGAELATRGTAHLGASVRFESVNLEEMVYFYQAVDIFTLPSLAEGFGRAQVEALSAGLPCLVHDYPGSREVLGEHGFFGDFTKTGALAALIAEVAARREDERVRERRHAYAYAHFSWDRLRSRYVSLFRRTACGA
jgi:1,2-diacylglycerol 3-alpha-glucosyltransferase